MIRVALISILLGLGVIYAYPQDSIVSIPDTLFLYALIEEGVDTNGDSLISRREAESVISLDVGDRWNGGIKNMIGIEAFVNLDSLSCNGHLIRELDLTYNTALKYLNVCGFSETGWGGGPVGWTNELRSLKISKCTALAYLDCSVNKLESLDLSHHTELIHLFCGWNHLEYLDLSNNTLLKNLECGGNHLKNLDLSYNTKLEHLGCGRNQLPCLDISKNTSLKSLRIYEDTLLSEVCVWEMPFPPDGIEVITEDSPFVYFTDTCIKCNDTLVYIPDEAFLFALYESGIDLNGDSFISLPEAEQVTTLNLSNKEIYDLTGLEHFTRLECLDVSHNQLTRLDIAINNELTYLDCEANLLSTLSISNNKSIDTLIISNMLGLTEVCVWSEAFPGEGIYVDSSFSPNAYFTHLCECEGDILEENDSAEDPVNININHTYSDLFVSVIDDDWYCFEIGHYNDEIHPVFLNCQTSQTNAKIRADLRNANGVIMYTSPVSSDDDLLVAAPDPGSYYLRIYVDSGSVAEYSLKISTSGPSEVYISPHSLSFSDADIYTTHSRELTILNQGTRELSIDSIHNSLLGSKIDPASALIQPGEMQVFTMEVFPRTLKEIEGDLHIYTSNSSYEHLTVPVFGNGHLSRYVVIMKEIVDTVPAGYWKAYGLDFPNYNTVVGLTLYNSVETYTIPVESSDNLLQPDSIPGNWVYTSLDSVTMILPSDSKTFSVFVDASNLEKGDYYADVVFVWFNPLWHKGYIPVSLHVKENTVSVSPCNEQRELEVYPNPTAGYLKIQVSEEGTYDICIATFQGHLIYQSRMDGKSMELDLSSFREGVYLITIRSKDFVSTRKIIKL